MVYYSVVKGQVSLTILIFELFTGPHLFQFNPTNSNVTHRSPRVRKCCFAANSFIVCGSPFIQCQRDVTQMLIVNLGVMKVKDNAAQQRTISIVSGSPYTQCQRQGDQNAISGGIKVWRFNAASQQTLLLSQAPHPSNAKGR